MISAFDLDKTLFFVNTSVRFGRFLYRKGYISTRILFSLLCFYGLFRLGWLSTKTLHRKAFQRFFQGKDKGNLEELAALFLHEEYDKIVFPPAMARFLKAKKEGHYVAILSNSPDFLVRVIATKLSAHEWAGTRYSVDAKGCIDRVALEVDGREKAKILFDIAKRQNVDLKEVYAYSDSKEDLPFLRLAGHPVVVNGDRHLRKIARKNKWEVLA